MANARRLVIAIVSTGPVFAMVLTGLANRFRVEAQRTVDSIGVDAFVVGAGATAGRRQLVYNGQPMITSIGLVGTPRQYPGGHRAVGRAVAVSDLLRPLKIAVDAIMIVAFLLWIVAVLSAGSLVNLSTLKRLSD